MLSNYDGEALVANSFKIGVKGFLLKHCDADEIEKAVRSVLVGDFYCSAEIQHIFTRTSGWPGTLKFKEVELELVKLLSLGKTSREISLITGLKFKTVETYRSRLLRKVGVNNAVELVRYFFRNGLL